MRESLRRTLDLTWCTRCGGDGHVARYCRRSLEDESPVETPSGNGTYAGPARVRTLPPGLSGEDLTAWKREHGAEASAASGERHRPASATSPWRKWVGPPSQRKRVAKAGPEPRQERTRERLPKKRWKSHAAGRPLKAPRIERPVRRAAARAHHAHAST